MLNLKALRFELPSVLQGLYNTDEYRKSQEYLRAATRFDLIENTFSISVLIIFWFAGGFNFLDSIIQNWGFSPLISGLLYIGIIFTSYNLISLPFSIYATFVIEQRFGFNRTTPQTFIADRVKMLVVSALLGGALLAGVLALFQYGGEFAWVYCWLAVIVFFIGVQFVAPNWIMPLFNKFKPMEPGELKEAILAYTRSVKYPLKNIFVMDGSKRSTKSNAFFTGFGANKRIAIYDNLIEKHNTDEIVAVLAHEIGHYKKKHIIQGIIISIVHSGLVLFLLSIFLNQSALYQAFYIDQPSIYTGIILFGLLYTPLGIVFSIILAGLSRKNEYAADRFATETIDKPGIMADALKKLATTNLSNMTPHPFYVFINYSHPPLTQRLGAIEKTH